MTRQRFIIIFLIVLFSVATMVVAQTALKDQENTANEVTEAAIVDPYVAGETLKCVGKLKRFGFSFTV